MVRHLYPTAETSSRAALGYPSDLPLQSGKPEDAAKVCNVVYALLHQRQRDIERHRETEDGLARLESSLHIAEQARSRMESRLLSKDREIGSLENKVIPKARKARQRVGRGFRDVRNQAKDRFSWMLDANKLRKQT